MDPARHRRADPGPSLTLGRSRLGRWLRPPRSLRPTRAGWTFFLLTFGVGFAAVNTGNNLLYLVLSLMLAFLVLSGVLSESALREVGVRRRLPRELFAGAPSSIAIELENRKRRIGALALVAEDLVVDERGGVRPAGRAFVLRVPPAGTETRLYRFVPPRRGELEFAGFRLSTRFPFGLFSKALVIAASQRTLVYPGIDEAAPPAALRPRDEAGDGHGPRRSAGTEVSGLRDHRIGDAPRRIHWRASLREGRVVVRDLEPEHDAEAEIQLRTRDVAEGERFERAVRRAASEAVALLREGVAVGLRTDSALVPSGSGARQRERVLGFLARVAPDAADAAARRAEAS